MVEDLDLKDKKVLIRVDFNAPLNEKGEITDDARIRATLTTIKKAVNDGGKVILMSHLGRPKGKVVPAMSLKPVAGRLSEILDIDVRMASDCIGPEVEEMVGSMNSGEVILLENLRFHKEETENDSEFAEALSRLGDVYVNNAFGTSHRAHASVVGITEYFDVNAAGFLMQKEIKYLSNILDNPENPFIAIIGGAKISGKIDVIEHLIDKVDALLIGGGMMFTFLKAMGKEIGNSLLEDDKLELAKETLEKAGDKLLLPFDCLIADEFKENAKTKLVSVDDIEPGWIGVDIGPDTVRRYYKRIIEAKSIIWNGPMGVFEMDPFASGTIEMAKAVAESTENGSVSIIGGGDSGAAIRKAGLEDSMTHISTGGGASLEMLEGKILPGIASLTDSKG
ncbi:MAG: phosphoglycerate kinase [bacterium]|nr:phosphoglycerate kinase [bacterium]